MGNGYFIYAEFRNLIDAKKTPPASKKELKVG